MKYLIEVIDNNGTWSWIHTGADDRYGAMCDTMEEAERVCRSLVETSGWPAESIRIVEVE